MTQIPDRDVPFTNVGDPAEITLDAIGSRSSVAPSPVRRRRRPNLAGTMHTEIDLDNPRDRIKPGMYGIAKVILDKDAKTSTLPRVVHRGAKRKAARPTSMSSRTAKPRRPGSRSERTSGIRVEILSGLDAKDEVIASTGSVSDGLPVRGTPMSERRGIAGARRRKSIPTDWHSPLKRASRFGR